MKSKKCGSAVAATAISAFSTLTVAEPPEVITTGDISPAPTAAAGGGLEEIVVTGTRQSGQRAADSPAPIQILSAASLKAASGSPDLMSTLAQVVPSLTMQSYGLDLAGNTLQAKLRGLSPNHVLVLVNGKRRHTTANLEIDTGSTFQGGAGVDLNFIPLDAIDHIEVLTEGAAAQYGTDAIAGVINIILKKQASGGDVSSTFGQYSNASGRQWDVSGNGGFAPLNGGYFNITGEIHNHASSSVGAIDERLVNPQLLATYPDSNLPKVPGYPALDLDEGDAQQRQKLLLINSGVDFDGGTELYLFGTYGHKTAASNQFYRLPDKAVYTDASTGATVYARPFGFEPQEGTVEDDYQVNGGVKGETAAWAWDLTTGFGNDKVNISTLNSYNPGYAALYGVPTPFNFYDGFLRANQWTTTADVNRDFNVGWSGPLNAAFGLEYRRESYAIGAGTPLSYLVGGASSFPGFAPSDAGDHSRSNVAGYVDFAAKPIDGLRIDAAGRFEHYSDFGNATVGKLTGRYDFTPQFAIRGTISNGFRAPTLAEEYYTSTNVNVSTAFVQLAPNSAGGKLLGLGDGLQPEHSVDFSFGFIWRPIQALSATLDLYQVTVTNRIIGSGAIIGTSGGTLISPTVNAAIEASGNQLDPSVISNGTTGINVFANGIDTRTRGADQAFEYQADYSVARVDWSIGATYTDTTITKYATTPAALAGVVNGVTTNELYDPTAYSDLTTANPKYVINFGALLTAGNLSVNLVERLYGPASEYENDDGDNGGTGPGTFPACVPRPGTLFICPGNFEYFRSSIGVTPVTNLDISYQVYKGLKVTVGANNLLNQRPPLLNASLRAHEDSFAYGDAQGVIQYPPFSPFGINGGFYYAKIGFRF